MFFIGIGSIKSYFFVYSSIIYRELIKLVKLMREINISKIVKEDKEYNFLLDNLNNLYYEVLDKSEEKQHIIHKEVIDNNVSEFSVFTEDEESIYILFKRYDELRCAFLNNDNMNTGKLYCCKDNDFDISEASMFILHNNIHVFAILKNLSSSAGSVIIHYLYKDGKVESNIICSLDNQSGKEHNYKYILENNSVKIFYSTMEENKEMICLRCFKDGKWSEERKLFILVGKISDIDVRYRHDKLYLSIIYSNSSINVLKIMILDHKFSLKNQRTYYSTDDLKNLNFIDRDDNMFIVWEEGKNNLITSSIINEEVIKTYVLSENNLKLFICNVNYIENNMVKRYKSIGYYSNNNKKLINITDIIEENKKNEKDIFQYSNNILKILGSERKREANIIKQLKFKIQNLQKDILNKQEKLEELNLKYNNNNKVKQLKENYEKGISSLTKVKAKLEKEIEEISNKNKELKESNVGLNEKIENLKNQNIDLAYAINNQKEEYKKKYSILQLEFNKKDADKTLKLNQKEEELKKHIDLQECLIKAKEIEIKKSKTLEEKLKEQVEKYEELLVQMRKFNKESIENQQVIQEYKSVVEKLNLNIEQLKEENHRLVAKVKETDVNINKLKELEQFHKLYKDNIKKLEDEKQLLQTDLNAMIHLNDIKLNDYKVKLEEKERLLREEKVRNRGVLSKLFSKE